MKNYPNLWTVDSLVQHATSCHMSPDNLHWYASRPLGYQSFVSRIKLAWLVFTGKADAVRWPANQ